MAASEPTNLSKGCKQLMGKSMPVMQAEDLNAHFQEDEIYDLSTVIFPRFLIRNKTRSKS